MTRSEKRDLRGKSEISRDDRLKKYWARGEGAEEKSKWGILTPISYSSPEFPHSLFSYFSSLFIFSTTVFCHNLVTTKHVATNTSILRSIQLRAGDTASSGGSGGRRKRVEASSWGSARICRLFFNNLYLLKYYRYNISDCTPRKIISRTYRISHNPKIDFLPRRSLFSDRVTYDLKRQFSIHKNNVFESNFSFLKGVSRSTKKIVPNKE